VDAPGVNEDELEVKTSAKHEHVAIETHLGDGAARQRVADSNESDVVVAVQHAGQCVLAAYLHIAAAVNHLVHQHHHHQQQQLQHQQLQGVSVRQSHSMHATNQHNRHHRRQVNA